MMWQRDKTTGDPRPVNGLIQIVGPLKYLIFSDFIKLCDCKLLSILNLQR